MNNPTLTIPSLSGTFGIPSRLAHNPKMPKEPSSQSRSNTRTERCSKYGGNDRLNKGQLVTRYIKHLADSADFKVSTINQYRNGLIGNRFEMPNVSYTQPLAARQTKTLRHDLALLNHNFEKKKK